jgi:hypothetical protein
MDNIIKQLIHFKDEGVYIQYEQLLNIKEIIDELIKNKNIKKHNKIIAEATNNYENESIKSVIDDNNDKTKHYDEYVGWMTGINSVYQQKNYVYSNGKGYEQCSKLRQNGVCYKNTTTLVGISGFMKCSLILYYVSQEEDFHKWYSEHDAEAYSTGY